MDIVKIYTDGACKGNPGPGGWGALLLFQTEGGVIEKELFGGLKQTTNNQMELMGAIEGLNALKRACTVDLYTDSSYVMQGMENWIHGWKRKGWRAASGQPVKNIEFWQALDAAVNRHQVRWHWVKGHAGDPGNERADALANRGVASLS
jgi:ribonuclease HI